jgi:hypothetical protein
MASNRLSDLPKFDRLSFTDVGEIKFPPRALLRTKSEEIFPNKLSMLPAPIKPASMIEQRRMSFFRPQTAPSVVSASRPPSEYDALHSHPVSWASFPGLPPQMHMASRSEHSVAILTPMQEEFSPPNSSVMVDGVILDFSKPGTTPEDTPQHSAKPPCELQMPATAAISGATENSFKLTAPLEEKQPPSYFHPNYQTQKRISQWLAQRDKSASISTVKSSSTSTSFAEHRRKRSQFYQLSTCPPKALSLWPQQHQRTMTESTVASTMDSDVLSLENQSDAGTSVTTAPEVPVRSSAIKNMSRPLRPIVSGVPDMPPCYNDIVGKLDPSSIIIKELGGPLRSPGVGVAF